MEKVGIFMMLFNFSFFAIYYIFGFFYVWYKCIFTDAVAFLIIYGMGFVFLSLIAELMSRALPRIFIYTFVILLNFFFCSVMFQATDDLAQRRKDGLVFEFDQKKSLELWDKMTSPNYKSEYRDAQP